MLIKVTSYILMFRYTYITYDETVIRDEYKSYKITKQMIFVLIPLKGTLTDARDGDGGRQQITTKY